MMNSELHAMTVARGTALLTPATVSAHVSALGATWQIVDANLMYNAQPDSMNTSAAVVRHAAEIAEQLGHHPDIDVGYRRLRISITTHDSGGLTALDFAFAAQLELWRRAQSTATLSAAPAIQT